MKDTDLAWAAGIVDGEGSIGLYPKTRSSWQFSLQIASTDPHMVPELAGMFGGRVYCLEPRQQQSRRQLGWWVTGPEAVKLVALLLPHLRTKRLEANEFVAAGSRYYERGAKKVSPEVHAWMEDHKDRISGLKHEELV